MLKNQRGHFMQGWELMPILGFNRGGHLPPEGFGPIEVHGVTFKCEPALGGKHRVKYFCIPCRKWIPYGRAGQHVKGAKHNGFALVSYLNGEINLKGKMK
jgi:hypothetical protein